MADPNVASSMSRKKRGGYSTQPLSTGSGSTTTKPQGRPQMPMKQGSVGKAVKPKQFKLDPREKPIKRLVTNGAVAAKSNKAATGVAAALERPGRKAIGERRTPGPSARAYERANPKARFKRPEGSSELPRPRGERVRGERVRATGKRRGDAIPRPKTSKKRRSGVSYARKSMSLKGSVLSRGRLPTPPKRTPGPSKKAV